jgi:tetratricopeptide (TPR) repeat protein
MKIRTCFVLFAVVVAVASMGSDFSYQYYKGSSRLQQGDFKGAVDALTKAIAKDPSNFGAFLNRGVAYDNLKQYDKALADFDSAIAIVPRFGRAFHNRGHVHNNLEQYEQAVADYDEALKNADNLVNEPSIFQGRNPCPTSVPQGYDLGSRRGRGYSGARLDRPLIPTTCSCWGCSCAR